MDNHDILVLRFNITAMFRIIGMLTRFHFILEDCAKSKINQNNALSN